MKRILGEDISIAKLKKSYFGWYYDDVSSASTINIIECGAYRYAMNEEQDTIIRYGIEDFDLESDMFPDFCALNENEIGNIRVWDVITNYWDLSEYDLELMDEAFREIYGDT